MSQTCVGYAPRRVARCGFVSRVRRMCTEACLRCLSGVFVRRLSTGRSLGCLLDARMRHMGIGACVRCLFGACVRRIRTEAGSRLSICRHCFDRCGSRWGFFPPVSRLATKTSHTLPTKTPTEGPHSPSSESQSPPLHLLRKPKDPHSPHKATEGPRRCVMTRVASVTQKAKAYKGTSSLLCRR